VDGSPGFETSPGLQTCRSRTAPAPFDTPSKKILGTLRATGQYTMLIAATGVIEAVALRPATNQRAPTITPTCAFQLNSTAGATPRRRLEPLSWLNGTRHVSSGGAPPCGPSPRFVPAAGTPGGCRTQWSRKAVYRSARIAAQGFPMTRSPVRLPAPGATGRIRQNRLPRMRHGAITRAMSREPQSGIAFNPGAVSAGISR